MEQFTRHGTEEQLQKAWKTQTFRAKNWSMVRGSAGAVQGGLRNLDVLWPSYRVIVLEEIVLDWKVVCSTDVKKIL